MSNNESIFVQIASYRDPECQHTVKSLFEQAAFPERVFVGICWQFVPEEDQDCFRIVTRPEQVRTVEFHAKDSQGACWARHQTQKLWQDENYTLQIDSHMRFEPGWDETLIDMHSRCESANAVLSTYPPGYTPPDTLEKSYIFGMRPKEFDRWGTLVLSSVPVAVNQAPRAPIPGAVVSACMLFGPSKIIGDVPYDPYLYFFGEEISLAARLWTQGWDIFHPNALVIYHQWKREGRKTHFDDHKDWGTLNDRARKRVAHLLGVEHTDDPVILTDIDKYGLGSIRSLDEYESYSGIDFSARTISQTASTGDYNDAWRALKTASDATQSSELDVVQQELPEVASSTTPTCSTATDGPQKVFESSQAIIFDDFLPESLYDKVYEYTCITDYEHINTKGKISRVWRPHDGFPMRGALNLHYFTDEQKRPDTDWAYPTGTEFDMFADRLNSVLPQIEQVIGKKGIDWFTFTVTSWLYPAGTGLSLHDDGVSYAGAYVYFLNRSWNIHWGGLLLLLAEETTSKVTAYKNNTGAYRFVRKKWGDESEENPLLWDPGFAKCVLPKRNRIVFLANDAFHMVTTVNPAAGDNMRRSLAGFFSNKTD